MINSPKELDFPLKQEGLSSDHDKAKAPSSSSSSRWLRLKDPRIVRVSRAFGGKDRHSKVCTIRGLRDRRVRLSVPTAIHLYDLQDRLGLGQPSKVVDWLLNAAKHEIDELPPLPVPPRNFTLGYPSLGTSNNDVCTSSPCQNAIWKPKSEEVPGEMVTGDKENWMNRSEEDDKQGSINDCPTSAHVFPNNNLLQRPNLSSFLGLLNTMPFGYQWENSSADVSQMGNQGFVNQADVHSINVVPFPSTLGASQVLLYPPGAAQSYFPSRVAAMEMDPRQIGHCQQVLSSSSHHQNLSTNSVNPSHQHQLMNQLVGKPFSLAMMTPKLFHSPNCSESQSHKDQDFPPK